MADDISKLTLEGDDQLSPAVVKNVRAMNNLRDAVANADKVLKVFGKDQAIAVAQTQEQVDSLNTVVQTYKSVDGQMKRVGVTIKSINQSVLDNIEYQKLQIKGQRELEKITKETYRDYERAVKRVGTALREMEAEQQKANRAAEKLQAKGQKELDKLNANEYREKQKAIDSVTTAIQRMESEEQKSRVAAQKADERLQRRGRRELAKLESNEYREKQKAVDQVTSAIQRMEREAEKAARASAKRAAQAKREAEQRSKELEATLALSRDRLASRQSGISAENFLGNRQTLGNLSSASGTEVGNLRNANNALIAYAQKHKITYAQIEEAARMKDAGILTSSNSTTARLIALIDRIDRAYAKLGNEATREMRRIHGETDKVSKTSEGLHISWRSFVRAGIFTLFYRGVHEVVNEIGEAINRAGELQKKIAEIQTIDPKLRFDILGLDNTNEKVRAVKDSFASWNEELQKLSVSYGIEQLDLATAAYEGISNQVIRSAGDLRTFGEAVAKFSVTAVTDTATATDVLSGVIQSYSLNASDAEEISAKLFETINLGRVRADEFRGSLGQVSVIAAQVGVSLDELLAAITATTIQGIKFSEVSTQLRGLFVALLKPTEAMKDFFAAIGVSSGEAAIKTFGLNGVLQKLQEYTRGSTSELTELINKMRGLTGTLALTRSGFDNFQKALTSIGNITKAFNNAVEISMETARKKLEQTTQTIKAYFTNIGIDFLNAVSKISEYKDLLIKTLDILTSVLKGAFIAAVAVAVAKIAHLTVAVATLNTVMAVNPFVAAATALAAFVVIVDQLGSSSRKAAAELEIAARRRKTDIEAETNAYSDMIDKRIRLNAEAIESSFTAVRQSLAEFRKANNVASDDMEKTAEKISSAYKALSRDIAANIDDINDAIESARNRAENLFKDLQKDLADSKEELQIKIDLAAAGDDVQKKVAILDAVIDKYTQIIKTANSQEELKEAQDKYTKYLTQRAELTAKFNEKELKEATNAREAAAKKVASIEKKIKDKAALDDASRLDKQQNQLFARGRNLFKGIGPSRVDEVRNEKNVKDLEAAKKELALAQAEEARLQLQQQGIKFMEQQLRMYDLAADRSKQLFEQEIDQITKLRAAKAASEILQNAFESTKNRLTNAQQALAKPEDFKSSDELQKTFNKYKRAFDDMKKLAIEMGSNIDWTVILGQDAEVNRVVSGRLNQLLGDEKIKEIEDKQTRINTILREGKLRLDQYKIAFADAKLAIDKQLDVLANKDLINELPVNEIKNFTTIMDELRVQLNAFTDPSKSVDRKKITDLFNQLRVITNTGLVDPKTSEAVKALFNLFWDLRPNIESIRNNTKELQELFAGLGQPAKTSTDSIQKGLDDSRLYAKRLREELAGLSIDLNVLGGQLNIITRGRPTDIVPQNRSQGGVIRRFSSGGAVGTDTVPAMLSPGEFVVNAEAARHNYSQLLHMNSNIRPKSFTTGETNVGNIQVTVNDSGNPQQTAREVVREINRGVRRGVLKLRRK